MSEPLKFALIGSAPASVQGAPYGDPAWHIWGCSPGAYGVVPKGRSVHGDPKTSMWWELHRYEPGQPWFSPEYVQFLRDHPCVAVSVLRKEVPNGWRPDKERLEAKYGRFFFTSSLAWMIVEAMERIIAAGNPPGSKIGLWGVDMAANEEYEAQRAGLHHFAEKARDLGIEVGVPPESDLFTPRFSYGFDENTHSFIKMRARRHELETRCAQATAIIEQKTQELFFCKGALDDMNYMYQTWADKGMYTAPPPALERVAVTFDPSPEALAKALSGPPEGWVRAETADVLFPAKKPKRKRSKANGVKQPDSLPGTLSMLPRGSRFA